MNSVRRWLATFIAIGGLALAVLALIHDVGVQQKVLTGPSFCSIEGIFDCEKVAASRYSVLFGIPISAYAVLFYLCLSALLLLHPARSTEQQRRLADLSALFATLSLGATIVLFAVSSLLIGSYCLYCSGLYVVSIALAAVCLPAAFGSGSAARSLGRAASAVLWFASFGLLMHREGWRRSIARVGMTVVVAAALLIYQSPILIVRHYYAPGSIDEVPAEAVGEIVGEWLKQPLQEIPLREESSGQAFAVGPAGAPVTIVEFSDFECPFCKAASLVLKETIEPYRGSVRLFFKHFPLDQACNPLLKVPMHENACLAAEIASCAGESDPEMFWVVHDAIFSEEELTGSALDSILAELPSETRQSINGCLAAGRARERLKEDIDLGLALQVRGTPAIYVNGRKLPHSDKITLEAVLRYLLKPER